MPHLSRLALLAIALSALSGCALAERAVVGFVYDKAELPEANVVRDLAYVDGPAADPEKHRFDLFLPLADSVRTRPWPTVVFVHGGSWVEGDKDLTFGGQDVYANIGRFFAQRGIGGATASYRLQPGAVWQEQVHDVARAVAAIREAIAQRGGDPDALVLMGHSAGAHLVTRVALDPEARAAAALPDGAICGVMPVSGAGFDLTDRESYAIADNYDFYTRRFAPPGTPVTNTPPTEPAAWEREATSTTLATADAPPFLILYAGGDYPALIRQSGLLDAALREVGAPSEVVVVPGKSHERIVPTLSRDDQTAGPAMLAFVRALACE